MCIKYDQLKNIIENVDYSTFSNISQVVEYQIDLENFKALEKQYVDPNVIVVLPEFKYLENKYLPKKEVASQV